MLDNLFDQAYLEVFPQLLTVVSHSNKIEKQERDPGHTFAESMESSRGMSSKYTKFLANPEDSHAAMYCLGEITSPPFPLWYLIKIKICLSQKAFSKISKLSKFSKKSNSYCQHSRFYYVIVHPKRRIQISFALLFSKLVWAFQNKSSMFIVIHADSYSGRSNQIACTITESLPTSHLFLDSLL